MMMKQRKSSLKGGTIPGSVSMEQFVPLLIYYSEVMVEDGWNVGFFEQPVFDNQRVRCILEPDTNTRLKSGWKTMTAASLLKVQHV